MRYYELARLLEQRQQSGRAWLEFLRAPSLSMGVYHLTAGQEDLQQPHTEDEVYVVLSGRGQFRSGGQQQAVGPGAVIFVERSVEHRFADITEDLSVLVFFAPPEGSTSSPEG
jgi:mannose-6-phosphate isomerase-like protein (cupin superfamily)